MLIAEDTSRDAVWRASPDQTRGELIEVSLSNGDRTRGAQPCHDGRILLGNITKLRASRSGRPSCDIDVVLNGKRQPEQGKRSIGRKLGKQFVELRSINPDCVITSLTDAPVDLAKHVRRFSKVALNRC